MNKRENMSDKTGRPIVKKSSDRRSQRTRQALIDALIALLAVKQYDAISIKDIVDRANVGRSTFYAYYQTKDDLLKSGFERALDMLLQHIVFSETNQDLSLDTTPLFHHAQGHYDLYRTLAWGSGFELITFEGHAALRAKLIERLSRFVPETVEPSVPLPILSYSLAGSLLILLKWWLDNKMPYSPERMDEIFQELVMPGIRDMLGLNGTK
jgi:AcrR family transcriptional regulator